MWKVIVIFGVCFAFCATARAEKLGFVVGIDTYRNLPQHAQLKKARNDARAVAAALRDIGFKVTPHLDLTRSQFIEEWSKFLGTVNEGDSVAFFFAGHGVEIGGNYLIASDAPPVSSAGREEQLRGESVSLDQFLTDLRKRRPRFSLLIVDACRDNPFERASVRGFSVARSGLANPEPPEGTFIMYSAGAGETALDRLNDADPDENSVYTRSLLPLLRTSNLSLSAIAQRVRTDVRRLAKTADHVQTPAYYDQVVGPACLTGACGQAADGSVTMAPEVQPRPVVMPPAEPPGPPSNGRADGCVVVGKTIDKPIRIHVGTQICAENGRQRAIVKDITTYSVSYLTEGGSSAKCQKLDICSFDWEGAPIFNINIIVPAHGGARSAELVSLVR